LVLSGPFIKVHQTLDMGRCGRVPSHARRRFRSVELGDATPANFRFAWKASKFITHWKRMSPKSENSIELMVSRLNVLGRQCGPVLFQLPPRFGAMKS
jgi:uncharacterized protein YecE (DUF72 family)